MMVFLLLLSIAFYCVDIYTCIKLLAFNEWSSQVKPYLSFKISKWLFAACIICSIVLLIYESVRGVRVFKTRNISLIYTNTFAKNAKSLQSYKCFCVLNEINPSSGFDKMAFYTYFTLHGSKKLLLADSPRQVINALTLYSVLNVRYGFWETLKKISVDSRNEAIILYTMTVSFVIWLFFIFQFFFAIVFATPVFYRVLYTLKFKALRQYVCVKVDHTVKKLARHHQKKSLHKLHLENQKKYIPTLPDVDPLRFTPSLPHKPETFTSINTKSSSTLRLVSENPFDDEKRQLYEKSTFKDAVAKPIQAVTHANSSTHSLHTTLSKSYINDSSFSLVTKPEPMGQSHYHNNSTYSLLARPDLDGSSTKLQYDGTDDNSSSVNIPLKQNRTNSDSSNEGSVLQYPKRTVFTDIFADPESLRHISDSDLSDGEDGYDYKDDSSHDESPNEFNSTTNLTAKSKSGAYSGNRSHVRPSLIRRAQEMDSEDYTRFNPNTSESLNPLQNQNNNGSSNSDIPVFQKFQSRKVLR